MRRMLTMEVWDVGKDTAEMRKACQVQLTAIPLTKKTEDRGSCHISTFGQVLRNGKALEEESLGRGALLILHVVCHDFLGVSLIKPVSSTSLKFGNRLRIELFIVYVIG